MQEQLIVPRLQSIFSIPIPKIVIAFFFTLFAPLYAAMVGLFVLVIIDYILGVWKAIKENKFSSSKMRAGAGKIILYTLCVLAVRLGEQQLMLLHGKHILFMSEFTILFFSLTELSSILEKAAIMGVSIPSPVLIFFRKQIDMSKLPKE